MQGNIRLEVVWRFVYIGGIQRVPLECNPPTISDARPTNFRLKNDLPNILFSDQKSAAAEKRGNMSEAPRQSSFAGKHQHYS